MRFIFPSLGKPNERVYRVNTDWNHDPYRVAHGLCTWLYWYPTYGDGTIAHAPDLVVLDHDMPDALGSLAVYLTDLHTSNREEFKEKADGLRIYFPSPLDRKRVEFAASVRYKPNKRQYYSLDEQKVSSVDSKRYDKRWVEVPSWADGEPSNVAGLLSNDTGVGSRLTLDTFSLYYDVYQVLEGYSDRGIPQMLKLVTDWNAGQIYVDAFEAVRSVLQLAWTEFHIGRRAQYLRSELSPKAAEEAAS